jgi:exonuclease SbcC
MILKSLKLENIRSYTSQIIEFPLGITLFEGDIGSGKSTILLAIEFALFGLGSEKGSCLLRLGANKGSVTLRFEVEGEEYEVYRSLERKGKNIRQTECYIRAKEGKLSLSASEMKEKILEILKFNEPPDPNAKSVIYRYAVFTPQEEMKAILWMKADLRLQTLRKAFRIEDYSIAKDNAQIILKLIKEKAIMLYSHASDLESKRKACDGNKNEILMQSEQLRKLQENEDELKREKENIKKELEGLQKQKEALGKAKGEIPLLKKEIQEKEQEISTLKEEEENLTKELSETIEPTINRLSKIVKPTSESIEELNKALNELRQKKENLIKEETKVESKIRDYESIEKNGVCPTCDRLANSREFKEKIEIKNKEKEILSANIRELDEKISGVEKLKALLMDYEKAQDDLKNLNNRAEKIKEQLSKIRIKKEYLISKFDEANRKLKEAEKELEEYDKLSAQIETTSQKLNEIENKLVEVGKQITRAQSTLEMLKKRVNELQTEIEEKEKEIKTAEKLNEYKIWIEDFFLPTLDIIEKSVMLSINQEFNTYFQKWWNILVDDTTKEARIDEHFTPIVEQDGYEIDINYLSGGEKTSLALAYRLALNSIVQKVSTGMKSNLLILDEPTDGFSKEQLFKLREILNEIKCPQVIIVSHEKELEAFADQVFIINKIEGDSEVKVV